MAHSHPPATVTIFGIPVNVVIEAHAELPSGERVKVPVERLPLGDLRLDWSPVFDALLLLPPEAAAGGASRRPFESLTHPEAEHWRNDEARRRARERQADDEGMGTAPEGGMGTAPEGGMPVWAALAVAAVIVALAIALAAS